MSAPADLAPDLRRILGIQAVRALLYGFGAVILGSSLAANGATTLQVGILGAAILAGMAIAAIAVGLAGDRLGRRRAYTGLLGLMGIVGLAYALTDRLWILVVLALLGVMSTDANENGPLTTLEQSMIGQAPSATRVRVFGRYNAVAYLAGALGALLAGGPAFVQRFWTSTPTGNAWFLVFPLGAAVCLWLAHGLSPELELSEAATGAPLERSRSTVTKLASLFAVDAFAGGFVITVFIVYWFSTELGASKETMSLVFFAAGLLQAGSSVVAPRLAARIGLLPHDGVHPSALQHPADADPAGAEPGGRDRDPAAALRALPDGRADATGLHRGDGRPAGTDGGGRGHQQRPLRGAPVRTPDRHVPDEQRRDRRALGRRRGA